MHARARSCSAQWTLPWFLVLAVLLLGGTSGHAAALVTYSFDGNSVTASTLTGIGASSFAANTAGNGLSAIEFASGTNSSVPSQNTYREWMFTLSDKIFGSSMSISADTAVTQGDYYTFTITPSAGNSLSLTSLTFDTGYYGASSDTAFLRYFFAFQSG